MNLAINNAIIGGQQDITADALANLFLERVEADGGVVEAYTCLRDRIQTLKSLGIWNKATAVWMPHGYKEDRLYAVKGGANADLGFTRAGTRLRTGPTYVEQVPYNWIKYSEDFSQAVWIRAATVSVTSDDVTAPDGNTTADRINLAAGTELKYIAQNQSSFPPFNGQYTFSVYAKYNTHQFIQLFMGTSAAPGFVTADLINGTISATTATGSITPVGNGWYRITYTFTYTGGATSNVDVAAVDDLASARAASTSSTGSYFLWGAQMVSGSVANDYLKTTDRFDVPALDYTNDTCPALSLEPARTNLLLQSEAFDNASWTKDGSTISTNTIVAPDGLSTADKIVETAVNATHRVYQSVTVSAGATITYSVYIKNDTRRYVNVCISNVKTAYATFDSQTGTITETGGTGTYISSSVTSVGDGWYRVSITAALATETVYFANVSLSNTATPGTANLVYLGTTNGIYAWGAQLEQASYATSYIPTTTATVSRVADAVNTLVPKGTNMTLYSEDFTQVNWTKDRVTVSSNAITDPNGVATNADKIIEDATLGNHRVYQQSNFCVPGSFYIFSAYLKAGERSKVFLAETQDSQPPTVFDLAAGTVSNPNATITNVGNGWYRCSLKWRQSDNGGVFQIGLCDNSGATNYTGDGVSGAYFWGAQFEPGEIVTAYRTTTTVMAHDGSVIGQTGGTFYWEIENVVHTVEQEINISDGTTANRINMNIGVSSNGIAFNIFSGGINQGSIGSAFTTGAKHKFAIVFGPNLFKLFKDGVLVGSDFAVTVPISLSDIRLNHPTAPRPLFGNLYNLSISNVAISDAEAIAWTTP